MVSDEDPPRFEDEYPEAAAILMDLFEGRLVPPRAVYWSVLTDGTLIEYANLFRRPIDEIARTPGPRVGRNDPCPCGSGKKFKRCHG